MSETPQPLGSIVVVGASLAGLRATETLRRRGFRGSITLIGGETHLPYDRPPLSKEFLAGEWDDARITLATREHLEEIAAPTLLGEYAVHLDVAERTVKLLSGQEVSFDGLVIATGATPRHLPAFKGRDGVVTIRDVGDSIDLRRRLMQPSARLVVVGGGFLGMEVAATARGLGAEVTVVEPLPTPLARVLGPEIGAAIAEMHRDRGVDVRTGIGVESVIGEERVEAVVLSDGSQLPADVVLVAVGVVPETTWLEGSGLDLDDGVVCAASLVCGPRIVAAGDLARFPHPLAKRPVRFEHRTERGRAGCPCGDEPARWRRRRAVRSDPVLLVRSVRHEDAIDRDTGTDRRNRRCGRLAQRAPLRGVLRSGWSTLGSRWVLDGAAISCASIRCSCATRRSTRHSPRGSRNSKADR